MIDTLTSALSTFLPESITAIAAPAIQGAGIGALSSLVTGKDPGMSALIGGGIGGAYGAFGNNGPLSSWIGGGGDPSVVGTSAADDPYMRGGDLKAAAPASENGWSDANATRSPLAANASSTAAGARTGLGSIFGDSGGTGGISKTTLALGALAALGSAMSKPQQGTWPLPGAAQNPNVGPTWNQPLNTSAPGRTATNPWPNGSGPNYWAYGGPEASYFTNNSLKSYGFADGGEVDDPQDMQGALGMAAGGQREVSTDYGDHYVEGPGDGQSDSIPAKLSDGEYIFDSATVSRIGQGSNSAGAKKLDEVREAIAKKSGQKQFLPKNAGGALNSLMERAA